MATAKDSGGFGRSFNAAGQFGRGGAPGGAGRAAGRGRGRAVGRGVPNKVRGMDQAEVKDAKKAAQSMKEYVARSAPEYERGSSGKIKTRGTSTSDSRSGKSYRDSVDSYKARQAQGTKAAVNAGKYTTPALKGTNSARKPAAQIKPSSGRMSSKGK